MPEMKLTTSELRALALLAKKGKTGTATMAKQLGMPASNTSRVLALLEDKGFISAEKIGLSKTLSLSGAKHATLLRKLILEFGHIRFDQLLSGASLEVLSAICCLKLKNRKEIRQNSLISEVSVARTLENLKILGVVQKKDLAYSLSPRFSVLGEFAMEFRHHINDKTALNFSNDSIILWESNHEFIIETKRSKEENGFFLTGLSVFNRFGISLMVPKSYYFYSPFARKLRLEDVIMHSILVTSTHRNMMAT
ncbi:MAG: helix-turn-helix transcriptional regulator, partial [Nitrososphaerales archaeon]